VRDVHIPGSWFESFLSQINFAAQHKINQPIYYYGRYTSFIGWQEKLYSFRWQLNFAAQNNKINQSTYHYTIII
jgi:hypothetical protein